MADMQAEDALNNNDMVKQYIASVQRRKSKKGWTKSCFKFLRYYKKRIFASILCVALVTAILLKVQSESLPPTKPNQTKKHVVDLKPMKYDHAGMNIDKLQRKIFDIREKQCIFEDNLRLMYSTFQHVRADIKQDGGYVSTEQANKIIYDALQLYDADKGGIIDYACFEPGASILATPDMYNFPLSDYEFFGFHIRIIYSQPPELITPDVSPGHCFAFLGNIDQQITRSQIYITAVTMENAPEPVTGDQQIIAPRTFAIYGFEDPHKTILTEISMFSYNIEKESTQTFATSKQIKIMAFAYVELHILDNHSH